MSINPLSLNRFTPTQRAHKQSCLNPKATQQREGVVMTEGVIREYVALHDRAIDQLHRENRDVAGDLLGDLLTPLSKYLDSFMLESPSCSGPLDSSCIVFSTELGGKDSALRSRQQALLPFLTRFIPLAKKKLVLPIDDNEVMDLEIRGNRIYLELSLFHFSKLKELYALIQKVVNCYETTVTQDSLPSIVPPSITKKILNITDPD